jgi:prepilin-type N-terminal cleavage/methylation domain-containing protein
MNKQHLAVTRTTQRGFTLTELLISMVILALLILLVTQVINTAATTVRPANKHIDTDTEARTVFDRMAVDFSQMLKRKDVDYFLKANARKYPGKSGLHGKGGGGGGQGQTDLNDYMAFYTQTPGYSSSSPSPISLVAYRVNGLSSSAAYNKLERRGEALLWNGISSYNPNNATARPIFFLPILIQDVWSCTGNSPCAIGNRTDQNKDRPYLETIGPNVFRFEYCYLLKTGRATDTPWNTDSSLGPVYGTFNALADVEAIGVTIAVIDPQNRALLTENNILDLQDYMADFRTARGRGMGNNKSVIDLEGQWNEVITDPGTYPATANMPRAAVSAIRIYSRSFDLKTL